MSPFVTKEWSLEDYGKISQTEEKKKDDFTHIHGYKVLNKYGH